MGFAQFDKNGTKIEPECYKISKNEIGTMADLTIRAVVRTIGNIEALV